ncbi:SDR family NAD(P)-dependent oxidoreductase [Dyella tabacisoli]|uniref:NADP-dependent 3-hydroxy acid dehydrogenase YdfG n=1 Tax=Dyella tabacisoli TaxID=2282381 RepID=A0A369UN68_9GAMM|nr:SDR family oxidoreductase [Dyella tabacisoli]RDD81060.1 SDR family NAD(P)-dependent oxidoreductase [Dyella tabacisoli]
MSPTNPRDTALITGASSGIGATYADRLARHGHDLVLVARDKARLEALAERLAREYEVKVDVLPADLTSTQDRARVEQRLRADVSIGMLINNAGMAGGGPLATADADLLEQMIQLNVVAPTRLTGAILPRLLARGHGSVINIASVLALAPEMFGGSYSATKAYLLNYTLALHKEASAQGVRVQAVLPGITRTEIWARSGGDINTLPAHMVMEVDEMVDAAMAGFLQGEVVTIPSLPDTADWDAYNAARLKLGPNLSRNRAADRYKSDIAEDA